MTRIVAGSAGGRRLAVPPGQRTRPTSDRAREALFGTLSGLLDLDGARVLDLYAGSGAVGLEAVSRGAASALLVDADARPPRPPGTTPARSGWPTARPCGGTRSSGSWPARPSRRPRLRRSAVRAGRRRTGRRARRAGGRLARARRRAGGRALVPRRGPALAGAGRGSQTAPLRRGHPLVRSILVTTGSAPEPRRAACPGSFDLVHTATWTSSAGPARSTTRSSWRCW